MSIKKTNAMRLLDGMGIPYQLFTTEVDEADLSAVALACKLGVSEEAVFKTLVLRGERQGVFMVCIPAAAEVDRRKAAQVIADKAVIMVPLKEVFPLTGYIRGGCSPLGTKKRYPVLVDETAVLYPQIYISAGRRGQTLSLAPDDLLRAVDGMYADLCSG